MGVPWGTLPRLEQRDGGDGDRMSTVWRAKAQCLCLGGSDTRLGPPVPPWVTHFRSCMVSASLWICKVVWVSASWESGDVGNPSPGLCCHLVVSLDPVFLSWKGQKAAASSHLSPTIHHYRPSRVTPSTTLAQDEAAL